MLALLEPVLREQDVVFPQGQVRQEYAVDVADLFGQSQRGFCLVPLLGLALLSRLGQVRACSASFGLVLLGLVGGGEPRAVDQADGQCSQGQGRDDADRQQRRRCWPTAYPLHEPLHPLLLVAP